MGVVRKRLWQPTWLILSKVNNQKLSCNESEKAKDDQCRSRSEAAVLTGTVLIMFIAVTLSIPIHMGIVIATAIITS